MPKRRSASGKAKRKPNKYIVFVMDWKKKNASYVKANGHIKATQEAAKHYRAANGLTKGSKKASRKGSKKRSRKGSR